MDQLVGKGVTVNGDALKVPVAVKMLSQQFPPPLKVMD
jgi:hypothetical protein